MLFIYEIAFQLRYPFVNDLLDKMTYQEFQEWAAYFTQRPIGWREDDRTYKLLQVQGVKERPERLFPSLKAIFSPPVKKTDGTLDVDNFRVSAFCQKLFTAKGGEVIDFYKVEGSQ
jgi:hypothetical protein